MPEPHSTHSVARYYDRNTRRFLAVGGGGASRGIHRLLWGEGVGTTAAAAEHVNRLLADRIETLGHGPAPTVLDMGRGVGGTLFSLATVFSAARLHGITISAEQGRIGRRLARDEGLAQRCHIHVGDFLSADVDVSADVIVAVESFVHAASAARFFGWAAHHLSDGGHLLLVDDFLTVEPAALEADAARHVDDFRAGWRAPGVCTVAACARAAAGVVGAGPASPATTGVEGGGGDVRLTLVSDTDLTPLIRLGRPRDRVISTLSPGFRRLGLGRLPFFGNMIGGNALQIGLREGFLSYRFLVFGRHGAAGQARNRSARPRA